MLLPLMVKEEHKVIVFAIIGCFLLFVFDAVIASSVFGHGSFLEVFIFDLSPYTIYLRIFILTGFIIFGLVISRLLSKRKQVEERLDKSIRFLNTIFNSIRDPFIILDREFRIVRVNDAYAQMKNISVQDLEGKKCYEATQGRLTVCNNCVVSKTFQSADPCAKEKHLVQADGPDAWVDIFTYPIIDDTGNVTHVIEYVRDVTDRKIVQRDRERLIQRLEFLSTTDSLTGLPNRRLLVRRMHSEIERMKRYASELSLILCDLDYFKRINDEFGHSAGDTLLKSVAGIMNDMGRTSDIVGRYGGDEFLLILPETSLQGAEEMAERIRLAVQEMKVPVADGKTIGTTLSLGITHCQGSEVDIYDLIDRIDNALYTSKREGRNKLYAIV